VIHRAQQPTIERIVSCLHKFVVARRRAAQPASISVVFLGARARYHDLCSIVYICKSLLSAMRQAYLCIYIFRCLYKWKTPKRRSCCFCVAAAAWCGVWVARILKLKLDAQGALKKREGSSLDYYNCGILSILKSSLSNINVRQSEQTSEELYSEVKSEAARTGADHSKKSTYSPI